jgi:CRP-like cAMP-binding protein
MSDSVCFGEMELITGEPPSATVRAERDTVLWSPLAPRFATQNDQLRPSLLECARSWFVASALGTYSDVCQSTLCGSHDPVPNLRTAAAHILQQTSKQIIEESPNSRFLQECSDCGELSTEQMAGSIRD